jgi:S1-C subfamily serine protease
VEASIPLPEGQVATGLFLIDTGQPSPAVVLTASFVAQHPGLLAGKQQHGEGGALVRLPELRLGKLRLASPIALVSTITKGAENPRLAGILGMPALSRFNFVLNEPYASLFLEPNSHTAAPFEADMSGLALRAENGRLTVEAVTPASPAARAHIRAGDRLTTVENKTVTATNLGSVAAALRSAPGVTVHLSLVRNGQPLEASLQLQRML